MPQPKSRRSRKPSSKRPPRRLGPILAWTALALCAVLVAGFVGMRIWFNAYLASPKFRRLMNGLTARYLGGEGEYRPLHFTGTTVFSDGFSALGGQSAAFSQLRAAQLRADFNPRGLLDGAWRIDSVAVQRLEADLDGPRIALPEVAPSDSTPSEPSGRSWIPSRIDLREASIRELGLRWGADGSRPPGSLEGTFLTIRPSNPGAAPADTAWEIEGSGGHLVQGEFPPLDLEAVRMRYRDRALYVTEAEFRHDGGGTIAVNGEVHFRERLTFDVALDGIPITPYIPEDWRAKLTGLLQGTVRISAPMPLRGAPEIEGTLRLARGELQALPLLDRIALFTRTQQFRRIALDRASGEFRRSGSRIEVGNFVAESQGLLRIEGAFTVENDTVSGTFEIGVAPASLRWLPGSQERVFTADRDGYAWTSMRLSGPVRSPKEDLTERLVAAARDEVLEQVEGVDGKVKDAARDILDFVSPFLK